ncbi:MAG TPA: DUF1634 domain-containing protein [Candidatus Limnocylindrales bacterium]|jgi:uncharacterized membrane protein|nr:DUF1634 domain-containing protein [Candidatus Limnocylindrales bacterium]
MNRASTPVPPPHDLDVPTDPDVPIDLDVAIARLLTAGTYLSVALLGIGVGLMAAAGVSPLSGGPAFNPTNLLADLAALRPAGFLWLGLIAAIATPSARVAASLVGYLRRGERTMAGVALLILGVIALSILVATATEG